MNEFNFRVANAAPRESGFEIGQNVGDTKTTYIYSYKTKYINGKSTGQKTNVDWDMESSIPSWVSVKYVFEGNDCKVTFTTLQENTGSSARTHTLVMKQRESGKTISFLIISQPNFTYTYYLTVYNVNETIDANIGDTVSILVQSYMIRSDGEKMVKQPSVGATPSFANKVIVFSTEVMEGGAPHLYWIVAESTAANTSYSERSEILLVTCGDKRKEVIIRQKAYPIRRYKGLAMKSYGNSLESRDTYVEFDNDTRYFKWAGSTNGLAMYMRNSQGFEKSFKSFILHTTVANIKYEQYSPSYISFYEEKNFVNGTYSASLTDHTDLVFKLPLSSGLWEPFSIKLGSDQGGDDYSLSFEQLT